jgi:hypothetical protein
VAPAHSIVEPEPIAGKGYFVTFSDEFTTLDVGPTKKWSPGIWYAKPKPGSDRIYARDGVLHLVSKRGVSPHHVDVTTLHHSGRGGRSFRYGYFEARMRWDAVRGAWPAFWLLSRADRYAENTPSLLNAEIGIFEGYMDDYYGPTGFTGTVHRNSDSDFGVPNETRGINPARVADMTTGFHTYAVLWTPKEVSWYFDGQLLGRVQPFDSTAQDMFMILTMQQASHVPMDASEMHLEVDYVRVWRRIIPWQRVGVHETRG